MTAIATLARVPSRIIFLLLLAPALAAEDAPEDSRMAVDMPPLQQHLLRQEMISHTAALHRIIGHLADNELKTAGQVAEKELGLSSMGKHAARTAGQGPGRFMPEPMRSIGVSMHRAASAFAKVAEAGNRGAAMIRLEDVTSACVSCHAAYRLAR